MEVFEEFLAFTTDIHSFCTLYYLHANNNWLICIATFLWKIVFKGAEQILLTRIHINTHKQIQKQT